MNLNCKSKGTQPFGSSVICYNESLGYKLLLIITKGLSTNLKQATTSHYVMILEDQFHQQQFATDWNSTRETHRSKTLPVTYSIFMTYTHFSAEMIIKSNFKRHQIHPDMDNQGVGTFLTRIILQAVSRVMRRHIRSYYCDHHSSPHSVSADLFM